MSYLTDEKELLRRRRKPRRHEIDDDEEDQIVADGEAVYVPLMLMDAMQREAAKAFAETSFGNKQMAATEISDADRRFVTNHLGDTVCAGKNDDFFRGALKTIRDAPPVLKRLAAASRAVERRADPPSSSVPTITRVNGTTVISDAAGKAKAEAAYDEVRRELQAGRKPPDERERNVAAPIIHDAPADEAYAQMVADMHAGRKN